MKADGRCKSCNAPIRWAVLESGRRMPLDNLAVEDGNVRVIGWRGEPPHATPIVEVGEGPACTAFRYHSHFVTCPNASTHRKKGKPRG